MIASKNAIDLIQKWEGCRLEAYQDQGGIWTIGWGSTGPGIVEGLTISQQTADGMLKGHIGEVALSVTDIVANTLNQNQFDAVVCFCYNVGMGNFRTSTMCRLLKADDTDNAALEFPKWNHVGGVVNEGLTNRRADEQALFLS